MSPTLSTASSSIDSFETAELRIELECIARHHAGHDDLAADAVQDALFLLWRRRTPPSDVRRWLRAAVLHRCRHHARTRARAARRDRRAALDRPESDPAADPLCELCTGELRERLERALHRLPAVARRVLALRAHHGLDYAAIAERLDVPIGTVRSSLHRARAALREPLAAWLTDAS
ncbi:MAG TPA: RNA polymerase sigma factor [Planctomycetota bacterium]|nr:RNA polymerase sigma factor [Planctomycetota bacterium]